MLRTLILLLNLIYLTELRRSMEPKIIGGKYVKIKDFPHSAFLFVECIDRYTLHSTQMSCGGSIINQKLIVTAAHCLSECARGTKILIIVGNEDVNKGTHYTSQKFIVHNDFNEMDLLCDIAVLSPTTDITLGATVKKVVLTDRPPRSNHFLVAGWGMYDEHVESISVKLKSARLRLVNDRYCDEVPGTGLICTEPVHSRVRGEEGYAAKGDSGSGLVQNGFILRGLVSAKVVGGVSTAVAYTDVIYFLPWIFHNANQLYCRGNLFAATLDDNSAGSFSDDPSTLRKHLRKTKHKNKGKAANNTTKIFGSIDQIKTNSTKINTPISYPYKNYFL